MMINNGNSQYLVLQHYCQEP